VKGSEKLKENAISIHAGVDRSCNNNNCIKVGYLKLHWDLGDIREV
jgi:hypothetical protein